MIHMKNIEIMTAKSATYLGNVGDKAIKSYEARKLNEARAALEAKARELGVSLEAIMGVSGGRKKTVAAAKYRHPENAALTWTGRGRTPKWVVDHEAQSRSRDDLLIA